MLRVRGASAIPEKDNLSAGSQGGSGALGEFTDTGNQLVRETLFDTSTFGKLPPDFLFSGWHCHLAQDDLVAVARDATRGISSIHHEFCRVDDRGVVVAGVIRGNDNRVVNRNRLWLP